MLSLNAAPSAGFDNGRRPWAIEKSHPTFDSGARIRGFDLDIPLGTVPHCKMVEEISIRLAALEAEYGIRVMYACESGSRAWGFESRDSDWDVRFIFAWPQREYVRVRLPADHIHRDFPHDLDITGWDLRKALHQAAKSSASVFEWLRSPIVYLDREGFAPAMRALAQASFRVRPIVQHYLGLERKIRAQAGEGDSLNGKKCLYAIRATLCARWALAHQVAPPVAFAELLPLVEDISLRDEILRFVALKRNGMESDAFPVSADLRNFLGETRAACERDLEEIVAPEVDMVPFDDFFLHTVSISK